MLSLLAARKYIHRHVLPLGLFFIFLLIFSSLAGFLHNHTDDPFHVASHENCPVSIWARTPINFVPLAITLSITLLVIQTASCFYEIFISKEYCFIKSSRAPPLYLA